MAIKSRLPIKTFLDSNWTMFPPDLEFSLLTHSYRLMFFILLLVMGAILVFSYLTTARFILPNQDPSTVVMMILGMSFGLILTVIVTVSLIPTGTLSIKEGFIELDRPFLGNVTLDMYSSKPLVFLRFTGDMDVGLILVFDDGKSKLEVILSHPKLSDQWKARGADSKTKVFADVVLSPEDSLKFHERIFGDQVEEFN